MKVAGGGVTADVGWVVVVVVVVVAATTLVLGPRRRPAAEKCPERGIGGVRAPASGPPSMQPAPAPAGLRVAGALFLWMAGALVHEREWGMVIPARPES